MTAPSRLCLFGILTGAAILPASAADVPPPAAYAAPVQPLSIVSEIRIGGAVQDPGSAEGKLPGFSKANVNGEILFAKPVLSMDPFWQAFVPRPTVGGSYNTGGRTSYAYLGATWTLEVFPETFNRRVFLDGFFGGVAHNGWTGPKAETPYGFNTLGCSPMFREAAALGFRLTEHWSIMATVEHMSNAGLCANNRGLTNYGGKIGYTF
ncbi:Lipid A 3-O-deacylase (PagL) [Methylobacterium sp. UNC378MF]|jgi:lipid A 3-O-deacylase|uniref:acyloxyacyl hydrolase n=1 Tax=Methylobacterium sp. UNC378MF TaxID=1502748 RepID=UPI000885F6D4|nr:acyloxyacyl hydrolase [Methylobacterium sp. UNC378MF]SDA25914.1 Lipid A 3-O-deacylase (PagL) [Methylobacterium sp. UNC378MF]